MINEICIGLNSNEYLLSVKPEEEEIEAIISEALEAFDTNTPGPQKFLEIYNDYLYILSGEAQNSLDTFFTTEPFPYLKVANMLLFFVFYGFFKLFKIKCAIVIRVVTTCVPGIISCYFDSVFNIFNLLTSQCQIQKCVQPGSRVCYTFYHIVFDSL